MKNYSRLCLNVISPKEKPYSLIPWITNCVLWLSSLCSVPVDTEITFFQPSKHVMSGCIMSYMKWLNGMWHCVVQHCVWPWELRRELKGLSATPMVVWIPGSGDNAGLKCDIDFKQISLFMSYCSDGNQWHCLTLVMNIYSSRAWPHHLCWRINGSVTLHLWQNTLGIIFHYSLKQLYCNPMQTAKGSALKVVAP